MTEVAEGEKVSGLSPNSGRVADVNHTSPLYTASSQRIMPIDPRPDDTLPVHDVQLKWAATQVQKRVAVLRRARFIMSAMGGDFANAMSADLARTKADTRVAELLPLLEACKFLERNAQAILATKRLGRRGLPFWLSGVDSEIQRVPFGTVLVIGPSNYPLFLPGAQTLQALAAGNAVIWKPGRGGKPVAELFANALFQAGLPAGLLQVTDDTVEAGEQALQATIDKVIFTGSAENARVILHTAAERLIPCVIEASGCDATIVLPSADLQQVVKALAFGMRLNGSATCMAPRRILLVGANASRKNDFIAALLEAISNVPAVQLSESTRIRLQQLTEYAVQQGATMHGALETQQRPILVTNANPKMQLAKSDLFAPVLSLIEVKDERDLLAAQTTCPFGLTAAIFGDEKESRALAEKLSVGTVLVNDLIVSTADPRIPFGGRRQSGYGTTRGAEGLLEMTTPKVVIAKRNRSTRQYEATGPSHEPLFDGMILASHGGSLRERWRGLQQMIKAGRELGKRKA
jgi:acyl-CoA reductase-like NAD-dependent aldehyde dehydrogenase